MQTGKQSPAVAAAAKVIEQAKATLDQMQAATKQAQANIDMINAQMDKLIVHAPIDGVVLVRSTDVGEVIQACQP